ncbi:hypothetical protein DAPPUDRAFT_329009 [Daphnia pulex]|uniref:Uncharacterized protein n=1 Tax=Daphnia pulex TaxID=6669 RepID=E9HFE2_DAPPU|nr:hypothetical protein DAPPUDRAFT_329009 [Daphnia pulex]|eukprot:EFX69549.1 hypothetical protein DAPPUDRAFT_329009 [Daphnia pulex]
MLSYAQAISLQGQMSVTKKPPATLNLFLLPARPRRSLDYEVNVIRVTGNLIMLFLKYLLISCDLTKLRCVTRLPGYSLDTTVSAASTVMRKGQAIL